MHQRILKKTLWIISLLCLSYFAFAEDAAEQAHKTQKQLTVLQEKIAQISADLRADNSAAGALQNELSDLEKRQSKISKKIVAARLKRKGIVSQIDDLEAQLAKSRSKLQSQKSSIKTLFTSIYILNQKEPVKLALNQGNIDTLDRQMMYMTTIQNKQFDQLRQISETINEIVDVNQRVRAQADQLSLVEKQLAAESEALVVAQRDRQGVLSKLKTKIAQSSSELAELKANEAGLRRLLSQLNSVLDDVTAKKSVFRPFKTQKGKLGWPIKGPVIGAYGAYLLDGQVQRHGILIKATKGAPVGAISHGRVVFADWLRGYGLLIILDHGDGFMSLYGHNQAIYRDVGEWVQPGDVISTVGDSGGQSQAALYFEIRAKGEPVNPRKWCCMR